MQVPNLVTVAKEQEGSHPYVVAVRHPTRDDRRAVIWGAETEDEANHVRLVAESVLRGVRDLALTEEPDLTA